eukprot:TRINITY_DN4011_c0_g1_i1.p1 TRINITY_DN4011_c0_g1~~TRINITY_DN4011_c0_g1_i1.p1  ORF type:complete len:386 (+),score=107.71 TRINITY_DN4011_c0_g1_i1:33-1190(+)
MADSDDGEYNFDPAVIIDNGSGSLKVGMAGDSRPQAVIPNIVGRPNKGRSLLKKKVEEDEKDVYIGDEVLEKVGKISITYPMENGIVKEWADMQQVWEYAYEEIEEDPKAQPVLLTEAPFNPRKNREKMIEIMFEALEVPALQIKMQALCSLYASGKTTGVVLDSGDGVTHAVPIFEGFVDKNGIRRSNLAGRSITQYLQRLLFQKGYNFMTPREVQFVQEIKEGGCYVAQDIKEEEGKPEDEIAYSHTLPDGQTVTLTDERFKASEALFDPMRVDSETPSLPCLVWSTIQASSIDSRAAMMANIILSGGNTLFPGLDKRLQEEVSTLKGPGGAAIVKVSADPARAESVFSGAAVLASLPSFNSEWLTSETYDEEGTNAVVHCFS